jgi:hypothetical protein
MTKVPSTDVCKPVSDDHALQWLSRQPDGKIEATISALADQLGWSRSMLRRRIAAWSGAGLITRADGSNGRSIISVAGRPATGPAVVVAGRGPVAAAGQPTPATHAAGPTTRSSINNVAFIAALALACVSGYFSILGLAAIFAAAFWPVVVMGATLEVGRLVTAAWLSRHWRSTPRPLKWTLTAMVMVLMGITSMGVFGFLTKAHVDHQVHATVLLADQGSAINGQIALQEQVVSDFDRRISQIDAAIEEATSRGRSTSAMALALPERKARTELVASRQKEARELVDLRVRKAAIDGERKRVEAEVGPVRYLAQLVGGADADLEKTVRLLILIIAAVFDPLAVLLLIAATR